MRCVLCTVSWTDCGANTRGVHLCDHVVKRNAEDRAESLVITCGRY